MKNEKVLEDLGSRSSKELADYIRDHLDYDSASINEQDCADAAITELINRINKKEKDLNTLTAALDEQCEVTGLVPSVIVALQDLEGAPAEADLQDAFNVALATASSGFKDADEKGKKAAERCREDTLEVGCMHLLGKHPIPACAAYPKFCPQRKGADNARP